MTPLSNRRPRLRAALLAGVVATGLAGGAAYGFADVPPPVNQNMPAASMQALPSFHPILERVMPAVVTVSVEMKTQQTADEGDGPSLPGIPEGTPFDDMLRHFFDQQTPPGARPMPRHQGHEMALGSGFIIDPSGYVVTNNHVAGNAAKVTVTLQDGTKHTAKVIGTDEKTDLALLKITADKPLPYVKFGDS